MIELPVYGDSNPVTCIPEYKRLVVATINNPTTPVIVSIGGTTYTSGSNLTLTARGAVCWTGVINLTSVGLTANTRYPWTVTQGSNTDSGSYYHAPAKGTNWTLLGAGCDSNTINSNPAGVAQWTVAGMWEHYKTYYDTHSDIAGMLFPDDLGYLAALTIDDSATSAYGNNTGLKTTVQIGNVASVQDDYYIGWCALLGMLGPRGTYTTDSDPKYSDNAWLMIMWAREVNRAFCRKNINCFPQIGDWEYRNDFGWDASPTKGTYFGKLALGRTAWNAFYGLGQPPNAISPTDTAANHWANELGDLTIVCPDAITNAARADWNAGTGNEPPAPNGTQDADRSTSPTAFISLMGAAQIADLKSAITTLGNKFCIFGMGNGTRYVTNRTAVGGVYSTITTAVGEFNHAGTQHPIFDHCLAEWQSLVTNSSTGLMANNFTNGLYGSMLWYHSDWHHRAVYKNVHPAYTGNLAENFYSIYHGTTGGTVNFGLPPVSTEGTTAGSSIYIEYLDQTTAYEDNNFGGIVFSIFGAENPPRMEVDLLDQNNLSVWNKQFVPLRGFNNALSINTDVTDKRAFIGGTE